MLLIFLLCFFVIQTGRCGYGAYEAVENAPETRNSVGKTQIAEKEETRLLKIRISFIRDSVCQCLFCRKRDAEGLLFWLNGSSHLWEKCV